MANPIDRGDFGIVFYASTASPLPTYVDINGQTQTAVALSGSMQRMPGSVDSAYFHVGGVARYTLQVDVTAEDEPILLGLLSIGIFMGKALFFIFLFMWVRWTVPRFRYDQVMKLGWQKLLPLAIANLLFYAILIAFLQTKNP